jgi:hypothetical protein
VTGESTADPFSFPSGADEAPDEPKVGSPNSPPAPPHNCHLPPTGRTNATWTCQVCGTLYLAVADDYGYTDETTIYWEEVTW